MEKTFKFRIYPTENQAELILKTFGCHRHIYNHYLELRGDAYKNDGLSLTTMTAAKTLCNTRKRKNG